MGWGEVGLDGVVQNDYLIAPRLKWTGLGYNNKKEQYIPFFSKLDATNIMS